MILDDIQSLGNTTLSAAALDMKEQSQTLLKEPSDPFGQSACHPKFQNNSSENTILGTPGRESSKPCWPVSKVPETINEEHCKFPHEENSFKQDDNDRPSTLFVTTENKPKQKNKVIEITKRILF